MTSSRSDELKPYIDETIYCITNSGSDDTLDLLKLEGGPRLTTYGEKEWREMRVPYVRLRTKNSVWLTEDKIDDLITILIYWKSEYGKDAE